MAHILGIDANSDLFTKYITAFREKLIFSNFPSWISSYFRTPKWPQHSIEHFKGKSAVQPTIDNYLRAETVHYITASGHGLVDTFTGFNRTLIWKADQDFTNLKGVLVHLLSCQTGVTLGQEMVRDGAAAFWGYTAKFRFWYNDPQPRDLTDDPIASVFIEMDCLIDEEILDGSNADQVYTSITNYFTKAFNNLKNDPGSQAMLLHNYRHLVGPMTNYGDRSSVI